MAAWWGALRTPSSFTVRCPRKRVNFRQRLTEAERKKLPRYPVPCFRMGRLACRTDQLGQGWGKLLLGCAVDRCLKARQLVAAYASVVDAKDDVAKAFYVHFGFKTLRDAPLTLYLSLGR